MFDLIVKNGKIVDGTGKPAYTEDIAIKKGKIAAIGHDLGPGQRTIDAAGLVVSPGFIDIHSHSDWCPFYPNVKPQSKLYQGITMELVGNCGISLLPVNNHSRAGINELMASGLELPLHGLTMTDDSISDYNKHLQRSKPATDVGLLIGHGTLRGTVMGFGMEKPTADQLGAMENLLDAEMAKGAFGLSLGLIYPPSSYADDDELIALAKVVKKHNGILAVHMRSESTKIFAAVDEMLHVAKESGVHLQISHLKLVGKPQWGKAQQLLAKIKKAKEQGVDVTCDQYPYLATCASLAVLVPEEAQDGGTGAMCRRLANPTPELLAETKAEMERRGGADAVLIITTTGWRPEYDGKTLAAVAQEMHIAPELAACKLLVGAKGLVPCCYFCLNEADMLAIMQEQFIAVGCDGYAVPYDKDFFLGSNPHPRSFGTFPRYFQTIREKGILTLEKAVYKCTSLPAKILSLPDRGIIAVGKRADITVFDFEKIEDKATYTDSLRKPLGIKAVIIGGKLALLDGEQVGTNVGTLVTHKG
jgi:N-acyl-D-amino-acid deacylase